MQCYAKFKTSYCTQMLSMSASSVPGQLYTDSFFTKIYNKTTQDHMYSTILRMSTEQMNSNDCWCYLGLQTDCVVTLRGTLHEITTPLE